MPLDKALAQMLMAGQDRPAPAGIPGVRAMLEDSARALPTRTVEGIDTTDLTIPSGEGPIAARLYRPSGDTVAQLTVFFHGGGFVAGSMYTHDAICREIAAASRSAVLNVDYRLAPEHPFPAGLEDAHAAFRWAHENRAACGVAPGRIALAGDSAGANLAIVTALRVAQEGNGGADALLLLYPLADFGGDYASRTENAEGYGITERIRQTLTGIYAPDAGMWLDPRLSPVRSERLAELPPTLVVAAPYDPLRDEGIILADALRQAGVEVEFRMAEGMIHAFANYTGVSEAAGAELDRAARWLGDVLTR